MRYLRTNTATRITVGPFLDKTDGITPEIALTVTSELLTFIVDTAGVPTLVIDAAPTASAGDNDMVHITSDAAGYYDLELTAAQTNYLGRATLSLNDVATHLPVFHEFMIVPAVVYDAMILGTDLLDVSVTQVNGAAQTATLDTIKAETVEILSDTTVIGSTGQGLTSLATAANLATVADYLDTEIAAILEDTAVIGALGAGLTALSTQASVDAIKAETALIVADTNELQTDDYPAALADIPTVAEFNARTLVAADYLVEADTIAGCTAATISAIGANVITAASLNADAGTEIAAAVWAKTGAVTSIATELLLERLYEMINNKMIVTEATGVVALRNIADSANVATGVVADLGATTQRDGLTWV